MTYEQKDFGGNGATCARPCVKFQHRWWLIPIGLILFVILVVGAVGTLFDVPTVYVANGSEAKVGCMTSAMTEPKGITDPACQKVLEGRYDKVWVAPDWRP